MSTQCCGVRPAGSANTGYVDLRPGCVDSCTIGTFRCRHTAPQVDTPLTSSHIPFFPLRPLLFGLTPLFWLEIINVHLKEDRGGGEGKLAYLKGEGVCRGRWGRIRFWGGLRQVGEVAEVGGGCGRWRGEEVGGASVGRG